MPTVQDKNVVELVKLLNQPVKTFDIRLVEQLIINIDVNNAYVEGYTLLNWAVFKGATNIVDKLLEHGANPNTLSKNGKTSLYLATKRKYIDINIVNILLKHGVNPDTPQENGDTPLHVAVQRKHMKLIERLIKYKANPNIKGNHGDTPLHIAIQRKYIKLVEKLFQYGADTTIKNDRGKTPLHEAVLINSIEMVELLLANGAIIELRDNLDNTALGLAKERKYSKIEQKLLESVQNNTRYTLLHEAVQYLANKREGLDTIEKLLETSDYINIQDHNGETPLHLAARGLHTIYNTIVKKLLEHGANPDIKDNNGKTPLDFAAKNQHNEGLFARSIIKLLNITMKITTILAQPELADIINQSQDKNSGPLCTKNFLNRIKELNINKFLQNLQTYNKPIDDLFIQIENIYKQQLVQAIIALEIMSCPKQWERDIIKDVIEFLKEWGIPTETTAGFTKEISKLYPFFKDALEELTTQAYENTVQILYNLYSLKNDKINNSNGYISNAPKLLRELSTAKGFYDTTLENEEEIEFLITPAKNDPAILLEAILDSCNINTIIDTETLQDIIEIKTIKEIMAPLFDKHLQYIATYDQLKTLEEFNKELSNKFHPYNEEYYSWLQYEMQYQEDYLAKHFRIEDFIS